MALVPSLAIPSTPKLRQYVSCFAQVKPLQGQLCQFRRCSAINLPHQAFCSRTLSLKVSMGDHNVPTEVKKRIGIIREKLREAMPISVQEFPWRKAENIILDRLLFLAQEAGKWSLILFFIFSSLSDIVYTFSINHELIIPIGLFVGCLTADFLKEISLEVFHSSEEKNLNRHLLGMYCLFMFVKFMSTWFAIHARVFLLHVANGGLMQLLWYWKNIMENAKNKEEGSTPTGLEAP